MPDVSPPSHARSRGRRGVALFGVGAVAGLALALGSTGFASRDSTGGLPWEDVRLLTEVLEKVKQDYVEPVDDHRLIESAVRGMVTNLDSHSQLLDADEYEEIRISTSGNYTGVGLEVNVRDGKVVIVTPLEGTPAEKAGIHSEDVIVSIDGMAVTRENANEAVAKLRGKAGTKVSIVVARAGSAQPLRFDLTRGNVQVHSVRSRRLEPGYAYVRISQFSDSTPGDLRSALAAVRDRGNGFKGVVLDLRNNPGGVLEAAVEVSDDFLDHGVIVSASGRGPDANFRHEARPGDLVEGAPIVVLVNGGSASASEIVAGALKDNGRATIMGSRTFGKGSVQTVMPLSGGRAIKLTTSRYYTPSGASINGRGIAPDVVLDEAAPTAASARSDVPSADAALDRALEFLKQGHALQTRAD